MGGGRKKKSKSKSKKTYSKAQKIAQKRIASGKTISQVKAANKKSMQDAARERNRKFQADRAAKAKAKADAAAKKKRDAEAKKKRDDTSRKAAVDRARKAAEAKKKAEAAAAKKKRDAAAAKKKREASKVEKPTGNPNVMSADGTFNRPGPGGPEKEADYTSYKKGSYYNQSDTDRMNVTNLARSTRNLVTTPARMLGINNGLTNMLIPKSNEAIQDARDQRGPIQPRMGRSSRGGSNKQVPLSTFLNPTREEIEEQALAAMPESTVTPTAEQTTQPTTPNTLIQPERFIDVGGGQQISADNMSDYLASLRNTWDQQSQAYQSQIGTLQGQIGGFESQVGGLQNQIGGYQGQIGGYQGQVSDFERTIADYRSQIGGYRGQVSDYERSLGDYRQQIGGLRGDIGDYRSQIGGLQGQIGGLQSDIGGYKGQIGNLQGDIKGYQGEISGLRGDVLGLRGDISNYQDRERKAQELSIRNAQRQRVAQSYGLGKKKAKVGGVKTGRIEQMARGMGPRDSFNRSGLRISSLNI